MAKRFKQKKYSIIIILSLLLIIFIAFVTSHRFSFQLVNTFTEGKLLDFFANLFGTRISLLEYFKDFDLSVFIAYIFLVLILFVTFSTILQAKFIGNWSLGREKLEDHTNVIDAIPDIQLGFWIALAAGLGLYIELMIIRIHSSYFHLFAYFKNVSLLSCFLGLGIGYVRGSERPLATPLVMPFFALQILFMHILRHGLISRILLNPISEELSLGLATANVLTVKFIVYSFIVLIFAFNALCFIPLGHLASRLMMRQQKLVSYSWNLIGSLAGIILFSFISFLWTPPSIWILLAAIGLMAFLRKEIFNLSMTVLSVVIVLVSLAKPSFLNEYDIYSPYQVLTLILHQTTAPVIKTGNVYYQRILNLSDENVQKNKLLKKWSEHYKLPYFFKNNPERVLVVGCGTGNDVAAAIRNGADEIDAVEIDPAILRFGKMLHPEFPYNASNVNAIISDARAYIRHTDKRYDLIVYGLLDSHTLLSGKAGGIRLDSYVYTVEGFRDARKKLKKDGLICMSFSLLSPEIGRKLFLMLKEAFNGKDPIVYSTGYDSGFAFLAGESVRKHDFQLPPVIREVTEKYADSKILADESTDDWPFLYMPVRKYPVTYLLMIAILFIVSMILIQRFVSKPSSGFSIPCFFLGAGFMLIETKGITELALVYGSTWFVISIVITAILIMAFLANFLVIKIGIPSTLKTYGLLFASLFAGLGLTYANLSSMTSFQSQLIMTIVLTLPLFFSGFAFSTELGKSSSVAVALSSNLLGAMLGGFLEYNSMYFGFRSLYYFALIMYCLALFGSLRLKNA